MFIETHLPFGLLRPVWEQLTRFLFEPSYIIAHEWHLKSLRFRQHWEPLGAGISYSLHLENAVFSNRERPECIIALRNTTDRPLTDVEVLVTARSANAEYTERRRFDRVSDRDMITALPSIPLKRLFVDDNGIRTPYSEVEVRLIQAVDDGRVMESSSWTSIVRPTYTEWLNSRNENRWGRWWNLDLIELKKEDISIWLRHHLVDRHKYAAFIVDEKRRPEWFHRMMLLIGHPLARFACRDQVVSVLFWTPIILRMRPLSGNLE